MDENSITVCTVIVTQSLLTYIQLSSSKQTPVEYSVSQFHTGERPFQIGLSSKAMRSIHQFFKLIIRFQLRPVPFHKLRLSNGIVWTGKLRDSLWNRLYEDRRHKKNRIERNNVRLCIEDLKRK
jgi:hypothetical protein